MNATGSIKIDVPKAVVVEAIMQQLERLGAPAGITRLGNEATIPQFDRRTGLPAFGSTIDSGLFAGLTIHDSTPYALVLLPGESAEMKWQDAMEWAQQQGGYLPSRFDALTLFTNLKKEFKSEYYWTGAPHASSESCAWMQDFSNGYQGYGLKDDGYRARAVRRVAI